MNELPFPLAPAPTSSGQLTLFEKSALLFALFCVITGVAVIGVGGYQIWQWRQQPLQPIVCSQGEALAQIYVDVGGSVENPGLYAVPLGSRVGDVIAEAGGLAASADPQFAQQSLNLSDPVKDGEKLYVPSLAERQQAAQSGVAAGSTVASANPASTLPSSTFPSSTATTLSINQATAQQLQALPGIGEKRAADIIAGRPFSALSELVEKKILTNALFSDLETLLSL